LKLLKTFYLILIIAVCVTLSPIAMAQEEAAYVAPEISYASGKILEITDEKLNVELSASLQSDQITQYTKVQILNGKYKDKIVDIENNITSNPVYDIRLKPNQRVLMNIEETSGNAMFYITDIERYPILMVVLGIFLALLVLIGGKKGIKSIISLFTITILVFFILVPAILNNYPPIITAVAVAFVATLLTLFTVGGLNKKSLAASLGTIISVFIAGLISLIVIHFAPLTGFHDQESAMLWVARPDLNFPEILAASVIIGALGAVMDVGMSIASSLYEIKSINNDLKPVDLIKSGMNVGRDVMGTMADTLILAYIGGSFSLALIAANAPFIKLISLNSIATEITAALTGSIGIVLCIPITAVISAYLLGNRTDEPKIDIPGCNQKGMP